MHWPLSLRTVPHAHPYIHSSPRPLSSSSSSESNDTQPSPVSMQGKFPETIKAMHRFFSKLSSLSIFKKNKEATRKASMSLPKRPATPRPLRPQEASRELDKSPKTSSTPPPPSPQPSTTTTPPGRPPFCTLPAMLHLKIASYLPASALQMLRNIPALAPFYPKPKLAAHARQDDIAWELKTRDAFEAAVVRPHMERWGRINSSELTRAQFAVLFQTRVYCTKCDRKEYIHHFSPAEMSRAMQHEGWAKMYTRRCTGGGPTSMSRGWGDEFENRWGSFLVQYGSVIHTEGRCNNDDDVEQELLRERQEFLRRANGY